MKTAITIVGCTLLLGAGCSQASPHHKKSNPYGYDVGPTIEEIAFFWTRPIKAHFDPGPYPPQPGRTYPLTPSLMADPVEVMPEQAMDELPAVVRPDSDM